MTNIMVLTGDGIGPEIVNEATNILDYMNSGYGLGVSY